jgi:7-cyano-7-deazaguanine synthase in queuosine biosynthesis
MNVVCELSGGADSALAAIYARRKYSASFYCLFVDYGQPYAEKEHEASLRLVTKIFDNAIWRRVVFRGLFSESTAAYGNQVASEYFPLRNLVISAVAASLAVSVQASVIVNGSKSLSRVPTDAYSFRDSTLPFYKMMEAAVNSAVEEGHITIDPILADGRDQKMKKEHVYLELMHNGIQPEETWSCYHPVRITKEFEPAGTLEPCGKCRNCLEKKQIVQALMIR